MKIITWLLTVGLLSAMFRQENHAHEKYVVVIHGGAGTLIKGMMTKEKEDAYRAGLKKALEAGYAKIKEGKSSLDAVQAAVIVLEDDSLFNAGRGAVFTHEGKNELDAAIMDGSNLMAGAVAGVTNIRNPVSAARAVMEKSEHVMMAGRGAEAFAKFVGLEIVDPSYFFTQYRWDDLQKALKEDSVKASHVSRGHREGTINVDHKFGTVGCVALDKKGHLAAATSTGGMTNKKFGRIGDSPVIGAGTYANGTVAVSCTGWGEYYIRNVVAHDLAAQMEYKSLTVRQAGESVMAKVARSGGDGGLIALDKDGNAVLPFNTEGMYRGTITEDGRIEIHIYKD